MGNDTASARTSGSLLPSYVSAATQFRAIQFGATQFGAVHPEHMSPVDAG